MRRAAWQAAERRRAQDVRPRSKLAVLALVAGCIAVAGVTAGDARPFAINATKTFLGGLGFHGKGGIHEAITKIAILQGKKDASRKLIANIQAGVENTDITHQFDSEYHFDNSAAQGIHYKDLRKGFLAIARHLTSARQYARANPEFLKPTYGSLREMTSALSSALWTLAGRKDCDSCSKTTLRLRSIDMKGSLVPLTANPNPDPHKPTSDNSVFALRLSLSCGLCGILYPVNKYYRSLVDRIESTAAFGLRESAHLPLRDPLRTKLRHIYQAVRAYRGYQDLGHAFHTTQDFFAHTNYVELMAGVDVEQPIPKGTQIPVPKRWADFSVGGLRRLMGSKFAQLESGGVATIWLGDGDYCLGSPFNPNTAITIPLPQLRLPGGITIGGPIKLPSLGKNPGPPPGLHYCHYKTSTTKGLNKDEPGRAEPSHANHAFARSAATKVSTLLWQEFLRSIGTTPDTSGLTSPPKKPPAKSPGKLVWTLTKSEVNPAHDPTPANSTVTASDGHLHWQVLIPPQVDFVGSWPTAPRRLDAGPYSFSVSVSGKITGGTDTQGFRTFDVILLVGDRWDGSTAVGVGQNCNDPIGTAPMSCTPPASGKGAFRITVPTPQAGATFSFGVGALNCSACYVRYEYTAR